jgi:hypothetical protein
MGRWAKSKEWKITNVIYHCQDIIQQFPKIKTEP